MNQTAITGAALATSLGLDRRAVWAAIKDGRCGTREFTAIESPLPPGTDGGEAPPLPDDENSAQSRPVRYLRRVLRDALLDAGFAQDGPDGQFQFPCPPHRRGLILGTTLHGMRSAGDFLRRDDPEFLRNFLAPAVARDASRGFGLSGPILTTCSACSSSLGAIALAITLLETGQLDLVAAGGYDPTSEYVFAGFNSLRLVASSPLRPFARDRAGMKVGEGYAIVILERADDAQKRRRPALAHIIGFGESADAHHLTQPHPQGEGAARAIESALKSAGLTPSQIDLIAAHATGTLDNDAAEYAALRRIWGVDLARVPVIALKSHLSHTLGAAGAVELILSAMSLSEKTLPPNANVQPADIDFPDLQLTTGAARSAPITTSLNLSLGFGGANTAMAITSADRAPTPSSLRPNRQVLVTGIGVVFPGAVGNAAFIQRFRSPSPRITRDTPEIDQTQIAHLLAARRVRRMSEYAKLSLAAAMLAFQDAGITDLPAFGQSCAALLGTTHGSIGYCCDYYSQIVRDGIPAANPMLFAEGVPNAAAAHLSAAAGIKGGCQTIIGSRTAGLDALGLAAARIRSGQWDRAIVGAAEEYSPIANRAYAHCRLYASENPSEPFFPAMKDVHYRPGTFVTGCGAITLILESQSSLENRGLTSSPAQVYGSVDRYAAISPDQADQSRPTPLRPLLSPSPGAPGEGRDEGEFEGGKMRADSIPSAIECASQVLADLNDPPLLVSSANGTWLDRIEATAIDRSAARTGHMPRVTSLCGHIAESFSVTPLAGIAALLLTGRAPSIFLPGIEENNPGPSDPVEHFAALATDFTGLVAGIGLRRNRDCLR